MHDDPTPMIISSDVDVTVELAVDRLCTIDTGTVLVNPWCIHEYEPGIYVSTDWEDAATEIASERMLLAELDASASTAEEFHDLAFDLAREGMLALELGVSGASLALCAAGCPTFASCGGHADAPRSPHPWIICAADPPRASLVAEAARASGCGLEVDEHGRIALWGPSVTQTIALADCLLACREQFDVLPETIPRPAVTDLDEELGEW